MGNHFQNFISFEFELLGLNISLDRYHLNEEELIGKIFILM